MQRNNETLVSPDVNNDGGSAATLGQDDRAPGLANLMIAAAFALKSETD